MAEQSWRNDNPAGGEEHVASLMDQLDEQETDALLAHELDLHVPHGNTRCIRSAVLTRAGFSGRGTKTRAGNWAATRGRPCLRVALVAALLIVCLGVIGIDKVAAAIGGLFGFVPGYGIVENEASIQYIAAELPETVNERGRLKLSYALATTDNISISYELRGYSGGQIYLYAGEQRYEPEGGHRSMGGNNEIGYYFFMLPTEDINTDTTYRLEIAHDDLAVEFQLTAIGGYDDLVQIGATEEHNGISLTAVPSFAEGSVTVELYPVNNSKYQIEGYYIGSEYVYQGRDLRLETSNGMREHLPQNFGTAPVGRYTFELTEVDTDLVLKLPYLLVHTWEEKNIKLPIPPEGERVALSKEIRFADCTLMIEEIEKRPAEYGEGYELFMTVRADNQQPNLVFRNVDFSRAGFWGNTLSGGYAWTMDDDGIMYEVYFALEESDGDTLRLKLSQPSYYLLGEYSLPLTR